MYGFAKHNSTSAQMRMHATWKRGQMEVENVSSFLARDAFVRTNRRAIAMTPYNMASATLATESNK